MTTKPKDIIKMASDLNALLKKIGPALDPSENLQIDITKINDDHSKQIITRLTEYLLLMGKQLEVQEDLNMTHISEKEMAILVESLEQLNAESQDLMRVTIDITADNKELKKDNEKLANIVTKYKAQATQLAIQRTAAKKVLASILLRISQAEDGEFNSHTLADIVTMISEADKLMKPIA